MELTTVQRIRQDFPALSMQVYGKQLVFLDSAASSLKPISVIEGVADYYKTINSNVHRGNYRISQLASDSYDGVRGKMKEYLHAGSDAEIVFTKGTTEAINLLAHGLAADIKEGDHILVTEMEHHANILPWQHLCAQKKAILKVVPLNEDGTLKIDKLKSLLNENTKILAVTHVSNVLGTINPLKEIIELAHRSNTKVVVDGAQGIVHGPVDVQDIDCDFYVFSGHKFYAPMGVGVLYGKEKWLQEMEPYQLGGSMIDQVSFEKTTFKDSPHKFEGGTPNVGGVIGLGLAIDYIESIGWEFIHKVESELLAYAESELRKIKGLQIIGNAENKGPISSFSVNGVHAYDIGTLLDRFGVACRTGNHCTQPMHDGLGLAGTVRASYAFYNTKEEIDIFIDALKRTIDMLR
jgi:cysteine desulfurase/selenocysteine lyase